jgi:imidazole glycerol phosphate synthase subunit HisF
MKDEEDGRMRTMGGFWVELWAEYSVESIVDAGDPIILARQYNPGCTDLCFFLKVKPSLRPKATLQKNTYRIAFTQTIPFAMKATH